MKNQNQAYQLNEIQLYFWALFFYKDNTLVYVYVITTLKNVIASR